MHTLNVSLALIDSSPAMPKHQIAATVLLTLAGMPGHPLPSLALLMGVQCHCHDPGAMPVRDSWT